MEVNETVIALPKGTRLEKYELLEVLGQGGGGITYLAIDHQLRRQVVVKEHFPMGLCRRVPGSAQVEPVEVKPYERSLNSFCREARILAAMNHAGVVPIHELFGACGTAFLVIDYVEGITLREWLCKHPSAAAIQQVAIQLLHTLEYMHGCGVVHRDIKPANILVKEDDAPIIIDFGAALMGEPTHTLTLVGTPDYAAPEQADPSVVPGPRVDIYGLGRSFRVLADEFGVRLPRCLAATLKKACQPAPENRYASAVEWLCDMEPWFKRRKWLWCAAVVLAVAIAVALLIPEKEVKIPYSAPFNLVWVENNGDIISQTETVPHHPQEKQFVAAALALQKGLKDKEVELKQKVKAGEWVESRFYTEMIRLQKEVNKSFDALVQQYIDECLDGVDPLPDDRAYNLEKMRKAGINRYKNLMEQSLLDEKSAEKRSILQVLGLEPY